LISNLYDFDPGTDSVASADLDEMDHWILQRTQSVLGRCRAAYGNYEFHAVYHTLNNFCSVDLSAQYLDIVKDRLYCEGTRSTPRRAAQTTLYRILDALVHLMAPILSFTAEEIWTYMPDKDRRLASVFLSRMPEPDPASIDQQLADKWDRIFRERSEVLKALELARAGGLIGHSLDAEVVVFSETFHVASMLRKLAGDVGKLEDVLIVSQFSSQSEIPHWLWQLEDARRSGHEGMSAQVHDQGGRLGWGYYSKLLDSIIVVFRAKGAKCERCWKYDPEIGKDQHHPSLCPRCAAVLSTGTAA
jgi:isoleucyl-tRNA synthetase